MAHPIKVLFLHATREDANEYTVHRRLAKNVDPNLVETYFIWQRSTVDFESQKEKLALPESRAFFFDFGRDQEIIPQPSKWKRGLMVLRRYPASLLFSLRKIREIKPDVIYTTQQRHEVFLASLLSLLTGVQHIIHVCYFIGPWLGRFVFWRLKNNKHIFSSCDFVRQTGLDVGVKSENIETMHHMIDFEKYNVPHDRAWLRNEFGLAPDTPIITSAARLDKDKGFVRLVKAFAKVKQNKPEARLLICGLPSPGTDHDVLIRQTVTDLNLENEVVFAGYRDDLPRIFAASDIFSQPIKYDASSLVILGAMVTGIPVVSSLSGSVPEVVVHQETGLLSEPDDIDGLANDLLTILEDKALAAKMGAAGRERALKHFGPDVISGEWARKLARRIGKREV
ncbi:MAG: glycosyltransferase family 4 protein [Ardenticatenaceae bacterium]|nr:glycosyltransferase family 4 protein [Ardenticatenaceae bacterium]MCB9442658.1 glycosyltransferase family 4 protein [Ardenticatenaceae bacterium]